MRIKSLVILTFCLFLITSSQALAQANTPTAKDNPDKDLPKSGVLSSSYNAGGQKISAPIPWNKKGESAGSEAPISGSVSQLSQKQWKMTVSNNSGDDFNVSLRLKQLGSHGETLKSDNFSFRLKAKSSENRVVSTASNSFDSELELLSWKRIVKPGSAKNVKTEDSSGIQQAIEEAEEASEEISDSTSEKKREIKH